MKKSFASFFQSAEEDPESALTPLNYAFFRSMQSSPQAIRGVASERHQTDWYPVQVFYKPLSRFLPEPVVPDDSPQSSATDPSQD